MKFEREREKKHRIANAIRENILLTAQVIKTDVIKHVSDNVD